MSAYLKSLYFMPSRVLDSCWHEADLNFHAVCLWTLLGLTLTALLFHCGFGAAMAEGLSIAG
jgi:hypothetical protein